MELAVTSAYLPCDLGKVPPTKEVRDVISHCNCRVRRQLIIGCDVNAHHSLMGSAHINSGGETT
jgi:hypothetical protein